MIFIKNSNLTTTLILNETHRMVFIFFQCFFTNCNKNYVSDGNSMFMKNTEWFSCSFSSIFHHFLKICDFHPKNHHNVSVFFIQNDHHKNILLSCCDALRSYVLFLHDASSLAMRCVPMSHSVRVRVLRCVALLRRFGRRTPSASRQPGG